MKKFYVLSFLALLVACSSSKKVQTTASHPDQIVVKLVQINDVYEIEPLNDGEYGGMARVAYVKDSIKALHPNTFIVLAGDFLNPSLLGTIKVDGTRLQGKQMIEVMNAMDFDLVTFGNHEFDLKESDLQKRLNESNFNWTSANVRHVTPDGLKPFYSETAQGKREVSDYSVLEVRNENGKTAKLGVFGVTIDSNPKDYVHYADPYHEAVRVFNALEKEADLIVGLTHVSLDQDKEIARQLPKLPLIMGGHEHYNMLEKEGNTIIAKADANAKTLYVHTLTYNVKTKNLFLDSELLAITKHTPSQPEVEKVVKTWSDLLNDNLEEIIDNPNEIIFHAETPWDGTDESNRGKQTNLGEVITKSMMYVYPDVEAAIVNGGSIRVDDEISGDVSSKDIFRILLFGGSVVKVELEGALLKDVLNFGKEARGTGAYLQRAQFSKDQNGNWLINNLSIEDNRVYRVAMSDFLLTGLDIPFLTPEHPKVKKVVLPEQTEAAGDIRKAVIAYLKSL